MHRFYAPLVGERAQLSKAQQHQIRRVLRLADGQQIAVFDGSGAQWLAVLNGDDATITSTLESSAEPPTRITLYQALIKPARFEWLLQKGVEVGIARFVPFTTSRTVAAAERPDRWRSIVIEAAEQSGRTIVPDISRLLTFDEALADAANGRNVYMPWEGIDRPLLADVHQTGQQQAIFIGPEGGFSQAEVDRAQHQGATPVSLGRRILRAETAGIVAATVLLHLNGEL